MRLDKLPLIFCVVASVACGGDGEVTEPSPTTGSPSPSAAPAPAPAPSSGIDAPRLITTDPGVWRIPGSVPDAQGGFADCGPVRTMLRSPDPTQAQHALNATTNGYSTCVMPGSFQNSWEFPNLPNVEFIGQDKLIYLNTDIAGDLRISGTRIQVNLVGGHVVRGRVCMVAGSTHISYDGYAPALC